MANIRHLSIIVIDNFLFVWPIFTIFKLLLSVISLFGQYLQFFYYCYQFFFFFFANIRHLEIFFIGSFFVWPKFAIFKLMLLVVFLFGHIRHL